MKCEQIAAYLPGFSGGDLRPETDQIVAAHVETCASCSREIALQTRVLDGLATLRTHEIEPPPFLADEIIAAAPAQPRAILGPLEIGAIGRAVIQHREQIASVAGTTLVAAGALYAIWRAARRAGQPDVAGDPATA